MLEYITAVQKALKEQHKIDDANFHDGEFPVVINGKLDRVIITDGKMNVGNFINFPDFIKKIKNDTIRACARHLQSDEFLETCGLGMAQAFELLLDKDLESVAEERIVATAE